MEKEQFWNKIVWYNFILCMLVVLIHSENTDAFFDAVPVLNQLEAFLVQKIAQIAVGGFFLCSGYLFYRNFSWNKLGEKWKKRFKSIVIPYVLWNVLYYLINYMITKIPFLSSLYPKTVTFSWNELVQAAFIYKYNAEFWFIQCLIVYICICPLIYLLIRNRWTGIAAIACVLLLTGDQIMFPYKELISHMINWLFLYMIGAYAGIHLRKWIEDQKSGYSLPGVFVSGFLAVLFFYMQTVYPSVRMTLFYYLSGAVLIWCLLCLTGLPEAREWMKPTFYIYAIHFMIVRFGNKLVAAALGPSMYIGIAAFFLFPCFVVVFCYYTSRWMNRYTPGVWKVISGNR